MRRALAVLTAACFVTSFTPALAEATPLGASILYPAYSAKEIKDENPGAASGAYWFDPDGPGGNPAFLGLADMATDGGGWNLALLSLATSPSTTTDIVSVTGVAGLTTGHTVDMTLLAVSQSAEIRHEIITPAGQEFDMWYTGNYHDPLPLLAGWTAGPGHNNTGLFTYHMGRPWSTASSDNDASSGNCAVLFGQPWYYGACWATIPVATGYVGPQTNSGNLALTSYAVWVRADGETLYTDPEAATVPEPTSLVLLGGGFVALACRGRRRAVRTSSTRE